MSGGTGQGPHNVRVEPSGTGPDLGTYTPAQAERLRVLVDRLPAMVSYWDRDMRNVVANQAYVAWFGMTPGDAHGRHVSEVIGEDLYRSNLPHLQRVLTGEEVVFETTFHDASGTLRSTEVSYLPEIVDGEIQGFFVQVVDVTRRVQAQRQMDEAERLAELGSWVAFPQTGEMTWSAQMFRIVGQDPATFHPDLQSLQPQVHDEDRERVVALGALAAQSGRGYEQSYRIVRPDGEIREVHSRVRAETSADGTVVRLLGTMQDVTSSQRLTREVERVNSELRQVNQLNSDVLGVVGHDVRQPLALLLGHLEELVYSWAETPEELRVLRAEKAFAAARRLNTLVDDILAMASADSGALATHPVRVEVADVARDALDGVSGGDRVAVHSDGPAEVLIDPFHLRQVLVNLVTNALRYGAPPVAVRISHQPDGVCVEVSDHGDGVPAEFAPHLFERFSRAEVGASARVPGNGFGLYVVRRLAEANGCRIEHGPHEPTGTVFRLLIPTPAPV